MQDWVIWALGRQYGGTIADPFDLLFHSLLTASKLGVASKFVQCDVPHEGPCSVLLLLSLFSLCRPSSISSNMFIM